MYDKWCLIPKLCAIVKQGLCTGRLSVWSTALLLLLIYGLFCRRWVVKSFAYDRYHGPKVDLTSIFEASRELRYLALFKFLIGGSHSTFILS